MNGVLYAASQSDLSPTLYAFSANGMAGCASTPITCTPLWTASLGAPRYGVDYELAVANGGVYVNGGPGLEAFDAAGNTNCSGTPVVCQPLWQASVNWTNGVPTVANGTVFATVQGGDLEAFDANGIANCSGSPKVCSPMWTSHISSSSDIVNVSNGFAYVQSSLGGTYGSVVTLDATGNTDCGGSPKVCSPLWEYPLTDKVSGVSVSGTTLYVGTGRIVSLMPFEDEGSLLAYDANGVIGCSGTPKLCSPIWTSNSYPSGGLPIVGDGSAFVPPIGATTFAVFDANGSRNCSGPPVVCNPVWTSSIDSDPVAIGGSVLYAIGDGLNVYAFDATGTHGCAMSVCRPLWSTGRPNGSVVITNAIVANGMVYVTTQDSSSGIGEVLVYGLP